MLGQLDISVVVPVYNESKSVNSMVRELSAVLKKDFNNSFEIIFVDDGSDDNTVELLKQLSLTFDLNIIANPLHVGKGLAVKTGILAAKGARVGYIDCDLAIDARYLKQMCNLIDTQNNDAVIATRFAAGGKNSASIIRKLLSFVFKVVSSSYLDLPYSDPQCGCKIFKIEVIRVVLDDTIINGFCFDTELLYVLNQRSYEVAEFPVKIKNSAFKSKVRIIPEIFITCLDLYRIKKHHG